MHSKPTEHSFGPLETQAENRLTLLQVSVTQRKENEISYTGRYLKHFEPGTYHCIICFEPLFSSEAKYFAKSSGFASFYAPMSKCCLKEDIDTTIYEVRTEIMCAKCGSHVGFLFEDGPSDKGGLRYSVNSASLDFKEIGKIGQSNFIESRPLDLISVGSAFTLSENDTE